MLIKSAAFSAEFDVKINNFTSICNTATNDNYIKSTPKFPIISLVAYDDKKAELYPENGVISAYKNGFSVKYDSFGGKAISATLYITACEDRLLINANIKNNSDVRIIETIMPRLNGICLGQTHEDDVILYPHHAGERSENPVKRYKLMAQGDYGRHWRAASLPIKDYFRREINYCGLASMSWMYYHDNENGLYIGSHDARFPLTGIIAETNGNEESPWMGFAFRKHYTIEPNCSYDSAEYCIAVSSEDWHYGAKIYREYINPLLIIQPNPEFLDDEVALNQCYNFKHSGKISNRFKNIPEMFDKGNEWGVRHMFMASWNRTGFDSCYPEYYPDMELGSAMEFRRGIDYINQKGGFSTLYLNARIFDVKSDFHKTVGEQMAIRTPEQKMIEEVYGPAHFTVNCPSDKLWQNYFIDTCDFAALAYGCTGIYLDQLASAEPYACYNKNHSHTNSGEFNNGYIYIMNELLQRLRKRNPNAYLMVENCGDIYGAYCWGNLTWNGDAFDEHFNLFKYTFPEYTQVNMTDPRAWVKNDDEVRVWFYKDMQRAILLGSVLWLGITDHLERYPKEYRNFARKALGFRRNLQPLIKNALYLDNKFIKTISEGCDASCWQCGENHFVILAGNHALKADARASFILPDNIKAASCTDIDGNAVRCEIADNCISLCLDSQRLFCIDVKLA